MQVILRYTDSDNIIFYVDIRLSLMSHSRQFITDQSSSIFSFRSTIQEQGILQKTVCFLRYHAFI